MLAKNRNIGHWWRFSGFFNMPNGAFFGRKVLRFYVRFLAFFVAFWAAFFLLFAGSERQPGNLGQPNAGRRNAGRAKFYQCKRRSIFLNPAQPSKVDFLHLKPNAKKSDPILQAAWYIFYILLLYPWLSQPQNTQKSNTQKMLIIIEGNLQFLAQKITTNRNRKGIRKNTKNIYIYTQKSIDIIESNLYNNNWKEENTKSAKS